MKVCLGCKGHGEREWTCFDKHHDSHLRRLDFDDLSTLRLLGIRAVTAVRAIHSFEHMRRNSFVPFVLALARQCVSGAPWVVRAPLADDPVSIGNPHHTNNIFLPHTFDFFGPPNSRAVNGWVIGSGTAGIDDWIFSRVDSSVETLPSGAKEVCYFLVTR